MNEAALGVPLVHTKKRDHVACPDRVDARRKIKVVRYQERVARGKSQNEPLVTATLIVVRQELLQPIGLTEATAKDHDHDDGKNKCPHVTEFMDRLMAGGSSMMVSP